MYVCVCILGLQDGARWSSKYVHIGRVDQAAPDMFDQLIASGLVHTSTGRSDGHFLTPLLTLLGMDEGTPPPLLLLVFIVF